LLPMKKFFRSVIDPFLFSNIFMSLCAVTQALVTLLLIGAQPTYPLLILLFTSTLFIYNISIFLSKPKHPEKSPFRRVRWFFAYYKAMVVITSACGVSLVPLFFLISVKSRILLTLLSVLSVGYSLPLFKSNGKRFGLRNVPGIKSLMITTVWVMSCVVLPIFESESYQAIHVSFMDEGILIAKRFLFIFALTIPFDIRDLFQDATAGTKTIPVIFGEKKAYLFCQLLLVGYMVLLFLFRGHGFNPAFFGLSLTTILMGWLIFKSEWEKDEYYYFFYMDGVLILQYLFLLAFSFI
jgi:4-hydroxybenzoate polyprenyltransferase